MPGYPKKPKIDLQINQDKTKLDQFEEYFTNYFYDISKQISYKMKHNRNNFKR